MRVTVETMALVSMSVGFALSFAIAHYVRKAKNK